MNKEIEHKFLPYKDFDVTSLIYTEKYQIEDLYLSESTRIRKRSDLTYAILTTKGNGQLIRDEFEFKIDLQNIPISEKWLVKTRIIVPYLKQKFELNIYRDIFYNNKNLVLIELEVPSAKSDFELPYWIEKEVTEDKRFYNKNLVKLLDYREFSVL